MRPRFRVRQRGLLNQQSAPSADPAQQGRHTNTDGVLHQQQANNHNQKDSHHTATSTQTGDIGIQANGGEEGQHQWVAQGHVEVHFPTHTFFQYQQRNRYQQSARYRFGNAVFFRKETDWTSLRPSSNTRVAATSVDNVSR